MWVYFLDPMTPLKTLWPCSCAYIWDSYLHHRWSSFACEWTFELCAFLTDSCPLSVAIWERNKIVIAIAACSWLSNLGTCIYCTFCFFGAL